MNIRVRLKRISVFVEVYKVCLQYKWKLLSRVDKRIPANSLYKKVFHKKINWKSPVDIIEKIAWMEIYADTSLWSLCADKYRMRKYVEEHGFGDCLPELYGCWNSAGDIDFSGLPKSFVLKTNNGCGTVVVVKDKLKVDEDMLRKKMQKWLKRPYGYAGGQYHYLRIPPCIIAEELLENDTIGMSYSPNSLIDYKVFCVSGEPQWFLVVSNRTENHTDLACYDLDWKSHPEYLVESSHWSKSSCVLPRPVNFDEMLHICREISVDFAQVRIDFYEVRGRLYIGELTFSTGYGGFTLERYSYLGKKMNIEPIMARGF